MTGSGKVIAEQRQVGGSFNEVELATVGTLNITQGEPPSLTMEGEDNILPLISSEQQGSRLVIRAVSHSNFSATKPLTYTLKVKTLSYIAATSAGSVEAGPLQADDLTTEATNAGSIKLNGLSARTYSARLSNAGGISAGGVADDLQVTVTNAGSYSGKKLHSKSARVSTSNAGSITVNATERVDATIGNVGNVMIPGVLLLAGGLASGDQQARAGRIGSGIVLLVLAAFFFITSWGLISTDLWPLLLVVAGGLMLLRQGADRYTVR